jgi:splicing factor 3B subunit 1
MSDQERRALQSYTAPQDVLDEFAEMAEEVDGDDEFEASAKSKQVAARQSEYHLRRFNREEVEGEDESYAERMRRQNLEREEERVRRYKQELSEREAEANGSTDNAAMDLDKTPPMKPTIAEDEKTPPSMSLGKRALPDDDDGTKSADAVIKSEEQPRKRRSRWDMGAEGTEEAKPGLPVVMKRSRWDQTPAQAGVLDQPTGSTSLFGSDIGNAYGTALSMAMAGTSEQGRNRYMSDAELDMLLPSEGYITVTPPADYAPEQKPNRPVPGSDGAAITHGFMMQDEASAQAAVAAAGGLAYSEPTEIEGVGSLAFFKPEDATYFAKILGDGANEASDTGLTVEELKEKKIMRLLLKIKNGTPASRKVALRTITDKAREFGAGPLFDKILPLLMERTLEDQERHLLVKVIDRILYKLDDLVRPYVHKILVVIEPLLIDEDYYARVEGREIISNLAKASGLAHMISTMRPDIDHVDEYVRNTTSRAFAVVASALGIPALLPFLKAVCRSKKSWQARHTGIRIVQQIAIMMGCAVLPHLRNLVDAIAHGLEDDQQKVRTMTALALAALAEAAAPYGIESFDNVLKPLWLGGRVHRGKTLAAFLKAIGFIIPLMDPEYASYYVSNVVPILIREFQTTDEEMKKYVLVVIKQCAATEGVTPTYIREEILPEFFKAFWVRRMALDRRNYKQLVETTVELAQKAGVAEIVGRIVNDLKDDSEPFRKMVMETVTQVIEAAGAADIDERLEVLLIDGIIYAFSEQTLEDNVMLDGFGTVVSALGMSTKQCVEQAFCSYAYIQMRFSRYTCETLSDTDRIYYSMAIH